MDIVNGQPTGSIRISFGFMSTFEDAQVFLKFIVYTFIKRSSYCTAQIYDVEKIARINQSQTESNSEESSSINDKISEDVIVPTNPTFSRFSEAEHICACKGRGNVSNKDRPITLSHIYLYPIKSCAAFQVRHCI